MFCIFRLQVRYSFT